MTNRQRIVALNFAIDAVRNMHGSVTGEDHSAEVLRCKCQYAAAIKGLMFMRRECYATVQQAKKAVRR